MSGPAEYCNCTDYQQRFQSFLYIYVCMYTAYPFSIVQEASAGTAKEMLSLAFQPPTVLLLTILLGSKKHFSHGALYKL